MDRITTGILTSFSSEWEINELSDNKKFERLAAYSAARRHFNRSFDVEDIVVAGGGDNAIDGNCVLCNNVLVTDPDTIGELVE